MELISAGLKSRKTGILAPQNLPLDRYQMEDVNAFFSDSDSPQQPRSYPRSVKNAAPNLQARPLTDVARRINFGDTAAAAAAGASYDLSAVPTTTTTSPAETLQSSVPLRSPLPEQADSDRRLSSPNQDYDLGSAPHSDNEDLNAYNYDDNDPLPPDILSPAPVLESTRHRRDSGFSSNANSSPSHRIAPSRKAKSNIPFLSPERILKVTASPRSVSPPSNKSSSRPSIRRHRAPKRSLESATPENVSITGSIPSTPHSADVDNEPDISDAAASSGDDPENYDEPEPAPKTRRRKKAASSTLPSPPPEGLRRSKRTRIAPLAYWRGERIVYTRANDAIDTDSTLAQDIIKIPLQEILRVVHRPEPVKTPRRRIYRKRVPQDIENNTLDEDAMSRVGSEWITDQVLEGEIVKENEDVVERIAYAPTGAEFQRIANASGDNFEVATLFSHFDDSTATGMLEFGEAGVKLLRGSGDRVLNFTVLAGTIEVLLHRTKFVATRGCCFAVPPHNLYGFRNLAQVTSRLYFVQTRAPPTADAQEDQA